MQILLQTFIGIFLISLSWFQASADEVDDMLTDNDSDYVTVISQETKEDGNKQEFRVHEKVNIKELSLPPCNELPLYFDICIPSACFSKTPFGLVIRKIDGLNQGGDCSYNERTKGLGGIKCKFKKDDLKKLNKYYYDFFISNEGDKSSLSDKEIEDFKNIKNNYCEPFDDQTVNTSIFEQDDKGSEIVSTPKDIVSDGKGTEENEIYTQDEEKKNEEKSGKKVEEPVIPRVDSGASSEVDLTKKTEDQDENLNKHNDLEPINSKDEDSKNQKFKSIMFNAAELNKIRSVLGGINPLSQLGANLEDPVSAENVEKQITRTYSLKSILFFNSLKWAIWVNDLKISSENLGSGLKVEEVNNVFAKLLWLAPLTSLDKISPSWRDILKSSDGSNYESSDGLIKISIPSYNTAANVEFKISPNQTFDVGKMKILEGN